MIQSDLHRISPSHPVLLMDFDQTIRNGGGTSNRIMKTLYKILEERGVEQEKIEEVSIKTRREGRFGIYNYILGLCDDDVDKFNELCAELFPRVDYSNIHRDIKLLKALKKVSKKYNLYIFTNAHRMHVDICCKILFGVGLKDLNFIKCFDITETYENGKFTRKQDEGGLEKACQRIGADMSECILIDDNKNVIKCAKSKGMRGIRIKNNKLELIQILKVLKEI